MTTRVQNWRAACSLAAAVVGCIAASGAFAADRFYIGPNPSVYSNPVNWSFTPVGPGGAGVPGNGDRAFLTNNLATGRSVALGAFAYSGAGLDLLVIDGQTAEEQLLQFDSAGQMIAAEQDVGLSGIGRYNHFAGSNTVTGTLFVGKNAASQGVYNLTGTGSLTLSAVTFEGPLLVGVSGNGDFELGNTASILVPGGNVGIGVRTGGVGTFRHNGGSFAMTNVNGSASMFIGRNAGSHGTYTMSQSSGAATLSIDQNLQVGLAGSGTFIQNAGVVRVNGPANGSGGGYMLIANDVGSTGAYTVNGGSLSAIEVAVGGFAGGAGGNGSFVVNNGSIAITRALRIWQTGAATINGGSVNVGLDTSIFGVLTVTGGTLNTPGTGVGSGLGMNVQANATLNVAGGTVNIGDFSIDGAVNHTGGEINITGLISGDNARPGAAASASGANGVLTQTAGRINLADGVALDRRALRLEGGSTVAAGTFVVGKGVGSDGSLVIAGGSLSVNGVLGVGNNGTLGAGNATARGEIAVSAGSLFADTIVLGNSTGGTGVMTVSGSGNVVGGGGINSNALNVNGGTVTVLDQAPPPGEDPVLDRAIVGGYLRDGAMNVTAGVVTSPKIKLGVTSGNSGTYTQTGGTVNVGTALLGSAAGGIGRAALSGGVTRVNDFLIAEPTGLLTISGNGKLDLTDAAAIFNYTGASPIDTLRAYLDSGYNNASWDGNGINSSVAAATSGRAIGYAEAAEVFSNPTTFLGQPIDATTVLLRFTLYGDTDLNGIVNIGDFSFVAANFNTGDGRVVRRWRDGDFNYDGMVNIGDFSLMASQFNQSLAAGRSAVPEPVAGGLVLAVMSLALRRRS